MTLFLVVLIVLLVFIIFWLLRRPQSPNDKPPIPQLGDLRPPTDFNDRPYYNPKENALLMLRPGFKLLDVKTYFGQLAELGEVKIVAYCQSCDFMLFSVEGLTAELIGRIVKGTTQLIPPPPPGGNPKPTNTGDLGPVIYGFNYKVERPFRLPPVTDRSQRQALDELTLQPQRGNPVLVAVLDTGLETTVASEFQPAPASHCMGTMGYVGYNVIGSNANTQDDFTQNANATPGHGTPVTGMVLRAAVNKVNIKILPVKVLDNNGQGTLLQVMCGIAFAKNAGAKIINASLGFYTQDPGQAYFFKEFIDRMTTDNTLIIAAAGNADEAEDRSASEKIGADNLRNLDKHLFYPAAYSAENPNVLTVTTVRRNQNTNTPIGETNLMGTLTVVDNQNYSAEKVQIGVESDNGDSFLNPFGMQSDGGWPTWTGSSFAAPKLTGIVAATYYQYLDETNGWYDRDEYLNWLSAKGFLKLKDEMQTPAFTIHNHVPGHLLMQNESEYYISFDQINVTGTQNVQY